MTGVRVAAIQHDIVWEDRDANFAHLAPMVAAAAGAGARLAVLSETFSTGFSNHIDTVAEPEGGPSSQFLAAMAAEHGLWVAGSCPETRGDDPRPYNTLVLAGPDGTQHRYRKIHPFTFSGEDKYFSAGDELVTVEIEGLRVSLFVCYDLRFADEFWQLGPDTDLFLVPANWPEARRLHWQALLQARAIENQCYVIGGQPRRRRRQARLRGRQPHHRPARRAARDRCPHRDDPARRHLRRHRRRRPRPVPLPS